MFTIGRDNEGAVWGMPWLSRSLVLFVGIVASAAFGHETIRYGELQCRVAVGVLEESAAFDAVWVFASIEVVAQREMHCPL